MKKVSLPQTPLPWEPLFKERRFVAQIIIVAVILSAGLIAAHSWKGALGSGTAAAVVYIWYATTVGSVDARVQRLPNVFTVPAAVGSVLWAQTAAWLEQDWWILARALMCGLIVFGFWYLLALIANVGWGDVKFSFAGGVVLGVQSWSVFVMGAFGWMMLLILIVSFAALVAGKRGNDSIAHGPTLGLAVVIALAFPLMFAA